MDGRSFFAGRKTNVCALLKEPTAEGFAARIRESRDQGADGIGLELALLPPGSRTVGTFRRLTEETPLPFYATDYRDDRFLGEDDEARQEGLLNAARGGVELIDVIGDLYAPSPRQWTDDPVAIDRQRRLLDRIHGTGAKVVISSHLNAESRTAEQVLEQLGKQSERGADMLKIVVRCETETDFQEAVRTFFLLKRELAKPFVFLGSGRLGRLQRFLGLSLGSALEFAVPLSQDSPSRDQPTIQAMKRVQESLDWQDRP